MTPVDQIHTNHPPTRPLGDCWRASIASLLDLTAQEVPHFVDLFGGDFAQATLDWLAKRGLVGEFWDGPPAIDGHVIATGQSPRGDWLHAVVARLRPSEDAGYVEVEFVHDPHPSRDYLASAPVEFFTIREAS